jgi:hypothetical protein
MRLPFRLLFLVPAAGVALLTSCTTMAPSSTGIITYRPQAARSLQGGSQTLPLDSERLRHGRRSPADGGSGQRGQTWRATPTGNFTIIDKDKTKRRVSEPDAGYPMATGVSLSLPMDSTKDLSILIRTPTAASDCIVKPPPGFSRWRELAHRCISRHPFPRTPSTAARCKSSIRAAIPIRPALS